MTYHLWDIATRFYYGQFDNEPDALALVRSLLDHYGQNHADDLELVIESDPSQNLTGQPLAQLAYATALPTTNTRAVAD